MSELVTTNLQILKPSRKAPKAGDIFICRPKDRGYFFGRVVATDAQITSMRNCILLYLFATESLTKTPPAPLYFGDLLVAPCMTNRLPWSRGYFETVAQRDFMPGEKLPVHCFHDILFKRYPRFFDEYGHELPGKRDPCGIYALKSYRTIDDAVSEALGLPLAPD